MKLDAIVKIGDFMRYCKMPYYYQATIKSMIVGDTLYIGKKTTPIDDSDLDCGEYVCEAWIEKQRGFFKFYATWTFPTKPSRPFIMSQAAVKIDKKGNMLFMGEKGSLHPFATVCRYINHFLSKMTIEDKQLYYKSGTSPLFNGVRIDKNNLGYRPRYTTEDGQLVRKWMNYSNYLPSHQLEAIVTAGIHLGQIDLGTSE
ncbi:hypothetical protein QE443_004695 [Pantoea ananatis]|uniref:hypothetical protein n=1 Tax=Pantoea ananas TaxID=553 RepID=UPI0027885899|nr:hypothetical protein [Pantoea ananatis]MDQ1228434.1 hypothetical protein [Pantoea ananatis]